MRRALYTGPSTISEHLLSITLHKELLSLGVPRSMIKKKTIENLMINFLSSDSIVSLEGNAGGRAILRLTPD